MSSDESTAHWVRRLQNGDHAAAQPLWERYFHRLVPLARAKLQGLPRRAADEEDVALSAFDSFCRGAEAGRFPQLAGGDDLWPLLVVITARKALKWLERERCQKRGAGAVRGESAWPVSAADPERARGIEQVVGNEPSPAFAAEVAEEYRRLLDCLEDNTLRSIAVWKMEGYGNEEIAARLGCVLRTVERKLAAIRSLWRRDDESH
jgi:DNA-directed RNA polymerase specialized sigma24 family protein